MTQTSNGPGSETILARFDKKENVPLRLHAWVLFTLLVICFAAAWNIIRGFHKNLSRYISKG
jgi:hypothetical protein